MNNINAPSHFCIIIAQVMRALQKKKKKKIQIMSVWMSHLLP